MNGSGRPLSLTSLIDRLATNTDFLAGWLPVGRYGSQELGRRLRLNQETLERLLLCRTPRRDTFGTDVAAIAAFLQVDRIELLHSLREVVSFATLAQADPISLQRTIASSGIVLAAARDTLEESYATHPPGLGKIRRLAESILKAAVELHASDGDWETVVAWHSPVAVVTLPLLGLTSATEWLALKGINVPLATVDRPLRGLLLAWRGSGVILLDGGMAPNDRRFTLAHEWGHFLLDYQEPRKRVLRRVPDLLDVVDGHRPVTADDRARAIIEQVTLGVHAHLIERGQHGEMSWDVNAREDSATQFALELLSPWDEVLHLLRGKTRKMLSYEAALDRAADLIVDHFRLPYEAAQGRARAGLTAIGRRRRFFER